MKPGPARLSLILLLAVASVASTPTAHAAARVTRLYACVTHSFKTLNLTTRLRHCPAGETKISWSVQGPTGPAGSSGKNGAPGDTGDAGAPGASGATGAAGPTGATGDPGASGPTGPPGASGSPDTPAQVLTKIEQVDGAGSGLDAELLDSHPLADLQMRVTGTCAVGTYVRAIDSAGAVTCGTDANSGGTVTSVATGFGLTGGPITGTGTVAADPTVLQRRVSGSCSANTAVQSVAQDGTVSCSAALLSAGHVLTPVTKQLAIGATTTFFDADGIHVKVACNAGPTAVWSVGPDTAGNLLTATATSHASGYLSLPTSASDQVISSTTSDDLATFTVFANAGGSTLVGTVSDFVVPTGCVITGSATAS
jgi:hypothetical protein